MRSGLQVAFRGANGSLVFWGLEALERKPAALDALARAIEAEPPLSHWKGRRVYTEKQRTYGTARNYAQRATQEDAADAAAWKALALTNMYLEDFAAAAEAAERALKLDECSPAALAALAAEQARKGDIEPALAGFKAALAIQPDYCGRRSGSPSRTNRARRGGLVGFRSTGAGRQDQLAAGRSASGPSAAVETIRPARGGQAGP